jgi:hypothetical protein
VAVVAPVAMAIALATGAIGSSSAAPALSVSIGPAMPYPSPGQESEVGRSSWEVDTSVTVRFNRTCKGISSRSTTITSFNGHPDQPQKFEDGAIGTFRHGSVWRTGDQLSAEPGDAVRYTVTVRCGSGSAVHTSRTFHVPAASCFGGPIPITELSGHVWRYGDGRTGRALHLGDLIAERGFRVASGSRVVLAAPECGGLRMIFGPGIYYAGSYDADKRGDEFYGGLHVLARGDRHAGGLTVGNLDVQPLGVPCSGCEQADPSSYEVRPGQVPDSVRVRVWRGWVAVRAEPTAANQVLPHALVRAGEEVAALCGTRGRPCALTPVRLFQPGESWNSPLVPKPERLATAIRTAGLPTSSELAPARSSVQTKLIPASAGEPEQIIVSWYRQTRTAPDQIPERFAMQQGILVWQREAGAWQLVYRYKTRNESAGLTTGDVNGDGHADVLVADETGGSGGCADWHLLATVHGQVRELLHVFRCDGGARLTRGGLEVDQAIGPCPYAEGSVHCYGGGRATYRRWRGTRLVVKTSTVTCNLPRLDPNTGCRPRKR